MKALQAIEEAYDFVLNPTKEYFPQLDALSPNGEMANRISSNKVLFKLCQIVDELEGEIKRLKDDRKAIAIKMVDLEKKMKPSEVILNVPLTDPTKPIANDSL